MSYINRPQRVWCRRALFQVHLWVGIVLGLYVIVIGLTGSILVFRDELAAISYPSLMHSHAVNHGQSVDLSPVIENARHSYPTYKLVSAFVPGVYGETFFAYTW